MQAIVAGVASPTIRRAPEPGFEAGDVAHSVHVDGASDLNTAT